jgi:hypothetical protein
MITKPTIIISSLGRTGTKFFQVLFRNLIADCTSLHEPDILNITQYQGTGQRVREVIAQIRECGAHNLIIRKALGKWSLLELSDARVRGELTYDEAVRQVLDQREAFVSSRFGSVYVESSIAYYGLIDVVKAAYEHHRVGYMIREGRDWVTSRMNFGQGGGFYDKGRIKGLVAHTWPTASQIRGDPYGAKWGAMSRFEKLCWVWATFNEYAIRTVETNTSARVFRFEDVFEAKDRYEHLREMTGFLTTVPGHGSPAVGALDGWLDRKIHRSSGSFPPWPSWSKEQRRTFREICGPLMERLGYSLD